MFGAAKDQPGIEALVARFKSLVPALIVLEASGKQEGELVAARWPSFRWW